MATIGTVLALLQESDEKKRSAMISKLGPAEAKSLLRQVLTLYAERIKQTNVCG